MRRFLRNLYILCSTYTPPYIPNLKEIAPAVREIFVLKSRLIFFVFFFFLLLRTKLKLISIRAKTIFSCFDFIQIWYTYRAIKDLGIQRFSWNSMPIWKSYTQFLLDFFQNFLSRLPNRALTLSIWNFYQAFEYY